MIDFPTYSFDSDIRTLKGIIDFEISNDLKLIYGSGSCLSGTAGGGCGTGLSAIYAIPYERGSFELLKTETDGNIIALFENEVISSSINRDLAYIFGGNTSNKRRIEGSIPQNRSLFKVKGALLQPENSLLESLNKSIEQIDDR